MNDENAEMYREGFVLSFFLEDGSVGFGEVSLLCTSYLILFHSIILLMKVYKRTLCLAIWMTCLTRTYFVDMLLSSPS